MTPTPLSREIAKATSEAKATLEDVLQRQLKPQSTTLVKIAVTPTFASRWLAARLPELRSSMKPVRLQISSRVELVKNSDIWIRHGENGNWPDLTSMRCKGGRHCNLDERS